MSMRWRARRRRSTADRGLTEYEVNQLATYNAERARGIVHTPGWQAQMAVLQARFDVAAHARMERWRERA
jgi:hypothetical protein